MITHSILEFKEKDRVLIDYPVCIGVGTIIRTDQKNSTIDFVIKNEKTRTNKVVTNLKTLTIENKYISKITDDQEDFLEFLPATK